MEDRCAFFKTHQVVGGVSGPYPLVPVRYWHPLGARV